MVENVTFEPFAEGAHLSACGETLKLETMGQLTALVFGGDTDEAHAVPEIPPSLRPVLDAAFPLPLLWYGYNYV